MTLETFEFPLFRECFSFFLQLTSAVDDPSYLHQPANLWKPLNTPEILEDSPISRVD
jgi:hypothetical protein